MAQQIEMCVIGLGFDEFNKPSWSSSKNEDIGTNDDLFGLLHDILMEEDGRRRASELPASAVIIPQMRRKTFKELGTPTVQATAFSTKVLSVPEAELLRRAKEERHQLVEAGELDEVGDNQLLQTPGCDHNLIGTMLEVRWRYWEKVTDPNDKRKKKTIDIWCEGEVVQIANGKSDKESSTCRKLLQAQVQAESSGRLTPSVRWRSTLHGAYLPNRTGTQRQFSYGVLQLLS
ncbi:MAG: hypothetical protein SGPRY_009350 [Prymnesium sp.]